MGVRLPRTDLPRFTYPTALDAYTMFRLANTFWGPNPMNHRGARHHDRFMVWVDAVGGFWVCLADQVVLGQPVQCDKVDIPILGDISSRHARVRRDGEGYVIEAIREVRLDGRPVDRVGLLGEGSRISLGEAVRLVFRRPHALSATARLDFISRHRTQPSADGILLMADSCILGPGPRSHIVCRDWTRDVVLYRHDEQLFCRTGGPLHIDGRRFDGRGPITLHSRIEGEGYSLSLEEI